MRKYTHKYKEPRTGEFPQDCVSAFKGVLRKAPLHLNDELVGRTTEGKLGAGVRGPSGSS